MRFVFFLSLPLYALDQWTKQLVLRFIRPDEFRIVIPDFFNLVNVTNTGAAFGSSRARNRRFPRALTWAARAGFASARASEKTHDKWRSTCGSAMRQ